MPVVVPAIAGTIAPLLASATLVGIDTPRLALGVAIGLSIWVPQIVVQTVDVGTAGSGSGGPIPVLVPAPLLFSGLASGFGSQAFTGIFTPALITGLSTGLASSFGQMLVKTTHAGVGTGAGVAKFIAPPAIVSMASGIAGAGLIGMDSPRMAAAIAVGLDQVFASLVMPIPIVGSVSPAAASGTGVGTII